jgi:predicted PurR-regulated permease PerM
MLFKRGVNLMNSSRQFDRAAGAFVFLVVLITIYLTKEFLSTILLSIVLVFLLKPLYAVFFRLTRRNRISSFFSMLIVFAVILAFLLGITTVLLVEISNLQRSGAISSDRITAIITGMDIWAKSSLPSWIYTYIMEIILKYGVQEIRDIPLAVGTWIFPVVQQELSLFASNLPVLFAQLIIVIFFTYYMLVDGKGFIATAVDLFPEENRGFLKIFLRELNRIYNTLFTVYFTTSMLSGVLAAIGFSLLGVPYPVLMGAVVGFFTLMPMLGPPFIFIPLALYYLFMGDLIRFLILLVFGVVVLMIVPENVIRPQLAQKSSRIHPIITLLAYTAPIFVVGIIGVFIGPALYGFLLAAYRVATLTGKHDYSCSSFQNLEKQVNKDHLPFGKRGS